jgi:hypothetical protein
VVRRVPALLAALPGVASLQAVLAVAPLALAALAPQPEPARWGTQVLLPAPALPMLDDPVAPHQCNARYRDQPPNSSAFLAARHPAWPTADQVPWTGLGSLAFYLRCQQQELAKRP